MGFIKETAKTFWLFAVITCVALLLTSFLTRFTTNVKVCDPANSVVLLYNEYGHGSGVIVDSNCVLTAKHVAQQPDLVIQTADGDVYGIEQVIYDPNSDLALLFIADSFDEQPLEGDAAPLEVGDVITLIATPYQHELMNCVLEGCVVKVDHDDPMFGDTNLDILDCHGGMGCSGGPVLDIRGHIRGILIIQQGSLLKAVPIGELDIGPA